MRILITALLFFGLSTVQAPPAAAASPVLSEQEIKIAALRDLCARYATGEGVPKDFTEAVKWCGQAAALGDADAQNNLGIMYYLGQGVPQDYAESAKWHRKAAEQGHAYAQNDLGVMYLRGEGVPQDYVTAHIWFNLASARFTGPEREGVVRNRDLAASKMTPTQLADTQRLAREWHPTQPTATSTSASNTTPSAPSVTNVIDQIYSRPTKNTGPSDPSPVIPPASGGIKINPALFLDLAIQWSVTVLFSFVVVYKIAKRSTTVQLTKATGTLGFVVVLFLSVISVFFLGIRFSDANPLTPPVNSTFLSVLLMSAFLTAIVIAIIHGLKKNSGNQQLEASKPSGHGSNN